MAIGETVAPRPPWTKCRTRSVAAGPRSTGPALWHQRSSRPTCIGRLLQTSDARRRPKAMVDRLTPRGQHRLQNLCASGGARSATPTHFRMRQRHRARARWVRKPASWAEDWTATTRSTPRNRLPSQAPAGFAVSSSTNRPRASGGTFPPKRTSLGSGPGSTAIKCRKPVRTLAIPPTPRNLPRAVRSAPPKVAGGGYRHPDPLPDKEVPGPELGGGTSLNGPGRMAPTASLAGSCPRPVSPEVRDFRPWACTYLPVPG